MRATFCAVWLAYGVAVLAFPASPTSGSVPGAVAIQGAFVAIAVLAMHVLRPGNHRHPGYDVPERPRGQVGGVPCLGLALGAIGVALLFYDRVLVQGVNPLEGLASARNQWSLARGNSLIASSMFSVLGYALGGCHFAAAALILLRVDGVPSVRQLAGLGACFVTVLAECALNGGRSSLMLLAAVCLGAVCLNPRVSAWRALTRPPVLACAAAAVAYGLVVFASRVVRDGHSPAEYSLHFLHYLGLEPRVWLTEASLPAAGWYGLLAWAYLVHSFATTCAIAVEPTSENVMVGSHLIRILAKLGLTSAPADTWFLSGRFPSLPGALYHQFGAVGVAAFGSLLGAVPATALRVHARHPGSILASGCFVLGLATLVLSPELAAFDLLMFPSVALGFLILAGLAWSGSRIARSA
jgi:hypothetical protein